MNIRQRLRMIKREFGLFLLSNFKLGRLAPWVVSWTVGATSYRRVK